MTEKPIYYFAYGSNLNKAQMKFRCPKAIALGGMELPNAQLLFNGVADVIYHKTKTAVGGLWKITEECEKSLDRYEGVSGFKGRGAYRKETIKVIVTIKGKETIADALIYVMNRDRRAMPTVAYLNTIRDGFKDFGLDTTFLNRALLDTQKEAAQQAINDAAERKARWAREDAERASRSHHTLSSWEEAKRREKRLRLPPPNAGTTDMFSDEVDDLFRDYEQTQQDFETRDFGEWPDRFTQDDIRDIKEIPPRQSKTAPPRRVIKSHDKSGTGSNIPQRKSVHLFDEPSPYRHRK
ncbi:gamma-glutamylcyclotransferase [Bradyrhizobium barranii]|uniref:Gamma-glutamylcyclotransferase n=1 Tax=Bradyrhizobium barranii TaxID=2992140 RepID=A0ABY3QYE4_9BRAD|nr:gamma-glutamylcyclotransferase family protein [Bradyrhizobium japonicum]UFW91039.1 gamma-glutamylcyclotransferase [Bradyrhizobium japonicum]